ncbi:MAG: thiamine biosynthesis protein ThiS [Deltaproteobacteria bacterium RIFCSPLOWO2_02_FULL_50_16]|nr:MAG: thiamine biosynthesis protein ThiS [Deltaproteobacteria bacterium GWA2_50_8]OGQ26625.1 MAG: thiamine biosynthesis protein ThiS [Deltaproteobacteria bacterium RIFCSPHIGHO2_02_FULL_50_15]OGQ57741.1 MAG: thiamine biosynthesis protein ThiS [Deltaproteobacteria bacterium RIFCSPLOWO2_02_FULL_50_16]OGQ68798.1 MAG: thiamine biosynthesis protein ThiS [Deltaproteobacteria bacterium RIFCSPLOWO2_12_FULL_50_11]
MPVKSLNIFINNELKSVEKQIDLKSFMTSLPLPHASVALALNGEVVPRSQWSKTPLKEGDHIEILQAVGGG